MTSARRPGVCRQCRKLRGRCARRSATSRTLQVLPTPLLPRRITQPLIPPSQCPTPRRHHPLPRSYPARALYMQVIPCEMTINVPPFSPRRRPSAACSARGMQLSVLLRPRDGDFVYSAGEFDEILSDIGTCCGALNFAERSCLCC